MSVVKVTKEQQYVLKLERRLRDEVVLVTGASSGIGAATAREFARYGAQVVLAARRVDALQAQVEAITNAGQRAVAVPTDLTDDKQIKRLIAQTQEQFGRIDVLVNNAGVGSLRSFASLNEEEIEQMMNVNLRGALLATHAVLPGMIERRHGAIISVASLAGIVAISPMYSATKFGLRGFALSLRREVAKKGITVSVVSPGYIRTAMSTGSRFPMPGPEVVARAIVDLMLHPRREIIVPGYYMPLAGIAQTFPALLDAALSRMRF